MQKIDGKYGKTASRKTVKKTFPTPYTTAFRNVWQHLDPISQDERTERISQAILRSWERTNKFEEVYEGED